MVTFGSVEKEGKGWVAKICWGNTMEVFGPFRWRWTARVVKWIFEDTH